MPKYAAIIKKIPTNRDIIVVGFSSECLSFAEELHKSGGVVYAYASDDTCAVLQRNMQNHVYIERHIADTNVLPIPVYELSEALQINNAFFVFSTDYYHKLFNDLKLAEGFHFCRIGGK